MGSTNASIDKIGEIYLGHENLMSIFKRLWTEDNLARGLGEYLKTFDNGALIALSKKIYDDGDGTFITAIKAIKDKFSESSDSAWLWEDDTIKNMIESVIIEYKIIDESSMMLGQNLTYKSVLDAWKGQAQFIKISFDAIKAHDVTDALYTFLGFLYKFAMGDFSYDKERFLSALKEGLKDYSDFYRNQVAVFKSTVSRQLSGKESDEELKEIMNTLPGKNFTLSMGEYFNKTQKAIDDFNQKKETTKLKNYWKSESSTSSPSDWSKNYSTPILSMVSKEFISDAKTAFSIINNISQGKSVSNDEAESAMTILKNLEKSGFFNNIKSEDERESAFYQYFLTPYSEFIKKEKIPALKNKMNESLSLSPYEWFDSRDAQNCVRGFAENEYNKGGYERAQKIINDKGTSEVKNYLMDLVKDNMEIGLAIIAGGR